jgi:hypothetical protein
MSIPGVFSPVRDGEKIHVDGGLDRQFAHGCSALDGSGHRHRGAFGGRAREPKGPSIAFQRAGTFGGCGRSRK